MKLPVPSRLVLALLAAGCASSAPEWKKITPPTPAPPLAGEQDGGAGAAAQDEILGTVAGIPLRAGDLLVEWYQLTPREVWLVVDKLVAVRLALAEAERIGIQVAPAEVEALYLEERRLLEQDIARELPGTTVEEFVTRELGQDPGRYAALLRRATADQLLIERAVRSWILSRESVALRLIVVPEGDMETIQGLLAEGADFEEVARVHSIDDTAERGGYVPYLVRQEGSTLTRAAFDTPVGELGGPLRTEGHELLFRVETRRAALPETWDALREPVLQSLAEHPVNDSEYLHWKLAQEREYPLDLRRLKALLGASPESAGSSGGSRP